MCALRRVPTMIATGTPITMIITATIAIIIITVAILSTTVSIIAIAIAICAAKLLYESRSTIVP